jgi:hypothetical protein
VKAPLHLFEGYGIEIEYMIVDRESLDVRPLAERLLLDGSGAVVAEVEHGPLAWSNELVLHVIELKTNGPAARIEPLAHLFQEDVARIDALLEPCGARLMPTAMHPWMDPDRETRLWSHEYGKVYATFDAIFGCRGHGWSNLQSVHLNLPFADDDEFGRLHDAIRFLLPVFPALAASSPVVEGRLGGHLDNRLSYYRRNCRRVPSVTGQVVPEAIRTRAQYEGELLGGIYRDLEPLDPDGVLRSEWVNARGAIARFDRFAIEIRVLDVQECPRADLAVAMAISETLRGIVEGRLADPERIRDWPTAPLARILGSVAKDAGQTVIDDPRWLATLGIDDGPIRASELWHRLLDRLALLDGDPGPLGTILSEGTLATRITRAVGPAPSRDALRDVYRTLCECLANGRMFYA